MPELSPRRRLLVLAICCMSLFIVGLDTTIVNIALPALRADLDASVSALQWVLVLLVLASVTFGIIEGPGAGWGSPLIVGCFVLGAGALAALPVWESRRAEPLIDLRFFRSAPFSGAAVVSGLGGATAAHFAQSSRTGWWILFGCGVAVLALSLATTGARARATAAPLESPVPVT